MAPVCTVFVKRMGGEMPDGAVFVFGKVQLTLQPEECAGKVSAVHPCRASSSDTGVNISSVHYNYQYETLKSDRLTQRYNQRPNIFFKSSKQEDKHLR